MRIANSSLKNSILVLLLGGSGLPVLHLLSGGAAVYRCDKRRIFQCRL